MSSAKPVKEKPVKPAVRRKAKASEHQEDDAIPELMIVGVNVAKNKSYYLAQKGLIQRVAHGVYIPVARLHEGAEILRRHAIRLAILHFKNAIGLGYSSAFTLDVATPEKGPPLVFVVGDYSYGLELGEGELKLMFVQSLHPAHEMVAQNGVYEFYDDKICSDPIGEFVVKVPCPELLILHNFERVKEWSEKKISLAHLKKFLQWLIAHRYAGSTHAFAVRFAEVAIKCNRLEEHDHALSALREAGVQISEKYLRENV